MKQKKLNPPKYWATIAKKITRPGLHHVNVYHDDWCDLLAGRGPCNCNPDVGQPVPHEIYRRQN
jgi:hypothetical protein